MGRREKQLLAAAVGDFLLEGSESEKEHAAVEAGAYIRRKHPGSRVLGRGQFQLEAGAVEGQPGVRVRVFPEELKASLFKVREINIVFM